MQWSHDTTPRYGQYLTHAHSHITRAVAAMDSCFVLVRTHQHGMARRKGLTEDHRPRRLLPRRVQKHSIKRQVHSVRYWPYAELCCVTIAFRWLILTFYVVTLASLLIQEIHTPYALPRLSCTVAATATTGA